ncbi:MAG: glycoside hydrolase family 27 protein [Verrucomicrobiota bacterium]
MKNPLVGSALVCAVALAGCGSSEPGSTGGSGGVHAAGGSSTGGATSTGGGAGEAATGGAAGSRGSGGGSGGGPGTGGGGASGGRAGIAGGPGGGGGAGAGGTAGSNSAGGAGPGGAGGAAAVATDGPPMGFNPYNNQWCNTTETQMRAFADAFVSKGLKAAGYTYVNLDCAWQGTRNSSGVMQAGSNFPSGIKALADYVHGKGLKFGIYTAPGATTCDNKPGSQGHETQDVNTYASWGADYIKLDWCGADYSASGAAAIAQTWKNAIAASGRPMVLSINAGASTSVAAWASTHVNLWRVGDDICDTWFNKTGSRNAGYTHCTDTTYQSGIYDYLTMSLDYLGPYSGKGHWGDPDMLQVGNGGLNLEEAKTHFSIWAMWSAPLIAGNDLTKMNGSDIASKVLLNTEVIAIDQDPKNSWATRIRSDSSAQIYKKTLQAAGTYAVALVNMSNAAASITFKWSDLGLSTVTAMRDLWAHGDITPSGTSYTATNVPAHGTIMLKLTGN